VKESVLCDFPALMTEALTSRCVLAGHYLRRCKDILEIGGGRNPIDRYLVGEHESVTVIDPTISWLDTARSDGCAVLHVRARLEEWWDAVSSATALRRSPRQSGLWDGVAMLGFEGWRHVPREIALELIGRADRVVVEGAQDHAGIREAMDEIDGLPGLEKVVDIASEYAGAGVPAEWQFRRRALRVYDRVGRETEKER